MLQRIIRRLPELGLLLMAALAVWATWYGLKHMQKYQPFAEIIGQQRVLGEFGLDARDAEVAGRSHGRLVWRLKADHITFAQDQHAVSADGIRNARLFDQNGKPVAVVQAGHADFSSPMGFDSPTSYGSLTLGGRVTAVASGRGGATFRADSISWNSLTSMVEAPGDVRISFPNGAGTAVARDVRYDTKTRDIAIGSVRGTFRASRLVK